MRVLSRATVALAIGAGLTLAPAVASAHPHHQSRSSGYVYVNDNSSTSNTVAGFRRHHDGSLTPLPGSPFATGGAGTGAAIGSQGSLQPALAAAICSRSTRAPTRCRCWWSAATARCVPSAEGPSAPVAYSP